jgi:hypothetical protein
MSSSCPWLEICFRINFGFVTVAFEFTFALSDVLWPATNSDEPQPCGIQNPQNRNDAIITN